MNENSQIKSQILLYSAPDGNIKINVIYQDESVWVTQKQMAELFDVEIPTVNYHLKEIFKRGELDEFSVIRKFLITAADGKNYNTNYYNLDAIISVGYRINSEKATPAMNKQFIEHCIKSVIKESEISSK